MNFDLDDTQKAFAGLARDFLDRECPLECVREAEKSESGFSPELYQKLAEHGFLGLLVEEAFEGAAVGYTEMALFCEEAGRHLLPGPYVPLLVAAEIVQRHGSRSQKKELLPGIASGEVIPGLAWLETSNDFRFQDHPLESRLGKKGSAYRLTGQKRFVPFGSSATHLLWLAGSQKSKPAAQASTLLCFPVSGARMQVSDQRTQGGALLSDVQLETACPAAAVVGQLHRGWQAFETGLETGRLATAAYALGAARQALDLGVDYAKQRHQFGRPIGSFQAIQHKLATCRCLIEQARWLTYHAAGIRDAREQAPQLAAMAKLAGCRALRETSTASSLTHGGYGFMQEYDIQLYFRRAKEVENWCGSLMMDREQILESELEKAARRN